MKKLVTIALAILVSAGTLSARKPADNREYLGLPGDNLNLFAVMKLFQESETLEAFERGLNNPDNMINNLDLNGDNYVDYIMVQHYPDGNVHNIVLRVALNKREYQDVAVITVENLRNGAVQLQIIGDEALYGPNYIIEPNYSETPNPGYMGNNYRRHNNNKVKVVTTTYYEVAAWPVIVYINRPGYVVWRSSWSWGYYPDYWRPWTPYYWHYYYGYHYNWFGYYHVYYRPYDHIRCKHYRVNYYTTIRHTSPTVIVNVNKGKYKNTYSRPELRAEGERLYSHRASMSGGNLPAERAPRYEETNPRPVNAGNDRGVRQQDDRVNRGVVNERPARDTERAPRASETRPTREESVNRPAPRAGEARPEVRREEPATRPNREERFGAPAQRSGNEMRRNEPVPQERSQTRTISRPEREERDVRRSETVRTERSLPAERSSGTTVRPGRSEQQNQSRNSGQSVERSRQSENSNSEVSRPARNQERKTNERSSRNSESSERSSRSGESRR
ncbi:MAG: hypothetical protein LWX09_07245 [Bacteroidia bacterium]|nr:hypothetical protein [Bacteroidia bacterium]